MLDVSADLLLGRDPEPESDPHPDWPPDAQPIGEMVLVPLYAHVTAGEGGTIDGTVDEYHYIPLMFIPDGEKDACLLIQTHGDSMIGPSGIEDGDWVLLCYNIEPKDGEIAVVDIDGEAVVKRIYRTDDSVVLQSDNHEIPPRIVSGPALEHTRVLGRVMRVIRNM